MRFLVDECTGPFAAQWLREQGHEVFSIYDQARGMKDGAILAKAFAEDWIIITNDKDFGERVFRDRAAHKGIVFLRLENERSPNKVAVLQRLLENSASELPGRFLVVTENTVRIAGHP
jgi:predicted nuclease of predicted toxin-antitoxin system